MAKSTWGGARPGAGRPPAPASKRRRNTVRTTLTDGELRGLERLARAEGIALGALLHRLVRQALGE